MLSSLYKLPKTLLAFLLIGGAIALMLFSDPPHNLCDTQIEHFQEIQTGILYPDSSDFHQIKSRLQRHKKNCETEKSPGSCYEYFSLLKKLLRDFSVLSPECKSQIFSSSKVKKALQEALTLMTALAWRPELLSGKFSKLHWLKSPDMSLYCDIKSRYNLEYGQRDYQQLEAQIVSQLPSKSRDKNLIHKWSLLSESCNPYR